MTSSNGSIFRVTGPLWGNSPVPVNFSHKGQWRRALMFSLISVWINGWVNNREAGDLRRHRGHYDASIMSCSPIKFLRLNEIVRSVLNNTCDRREHAIFWLFGAVIKKTGAHLIADRSFGPASDVHQLQTRRREIPHMPPLWYALAFGAVSVKISLRILLFCHNHWSPKYPKLQIDEG